MIKRTDESITLSGIGFFSKPKAQLLKILENSLRHSGKGKTEVVVTPNPEQVVQSRVNSRFNKIINQADYVLPDGVGLIWASRFLSLLGKSQVIKKRIAGVDVVTELLKIAKQQKLKIMIVGGRDYDQFLNKLPISEDLVIWSPVYEDIKHPKPGEERFVTNMIKDQKPSLVFVALGAPQQEFWIDDHLDLLRSAQVRLVMSVGGSFDYLLGKVRRAPKWLRQLGLEWLFRLVMEPWRWRRQLKLIEFMKIVASEALK